MKQLNFIALDDKFDIVDFLYPTNIQWNSRYYSYGDFSISILVSDYSKEMKYVYEKNRGQVAIINKTSYSYTGTGKRIQISGFFIEKIFDKKIAYPAFNGSGEMTDVLIRFINLYKEDLPIRNIIAREKGSVINFQETGSEIGKKLYEVLQTQEMSFKLVFDFESKLFDLILFKGLDRTQNQTANEFITFSTKMDNLTDLNVDIDDSNYKNFFIIAGGGEGEKRLYQLFDNSNGEELRKQFIDARDLRYNPESQKLSQYLDELVQRGKEKSKEYEIIENSTFKTRLYSYEYLVDFDIGDKASVVIEDIEKEAESRIIGVFEVVKENKYTVEIEFGNQIIKRSDVK